MAVNDRQAVSLGDIQNVDPDDDVDDIQRHSQFAEPNDSDREERDKNPQSEAEHGAGPWRERI